MTRRSTLAGLAFSSPAIVFFGIFGLAPLVYALWESLLDDNMMTQPRFVGLANYHFLFTSTVFRGAALNTAVFVVGTFGPMLVLAFALALLLNLPLRLRTFYRLVIFLPVVTSDVVTAIIWILLYTQNGPANDLLHFLGLPRIGWINSGQWAMFSIVLMMIWYQLGYYLVLFLSGLQGIPAELYEAAKVDGASAWHRMRYITFPLMKATWAFASTIALINGFTIFVPMLLMTNGGPGYSTTVVSLLLYQTGFSYLQMGRAASMSVLIFIVVMAITLIQVRYIFRAEEVS